MSLIDLEGMEPKTLGSILAETKSPVNQLPVSEAPVIETLAERVHSLDISISRGWIRLHWSASRKETYDYVALCNRPPQGDPYAYLSGQWQWATKGNAYTTGTAAQSRTNYWVMYCRWSYERNRYEVQKEVHRWIP